MTNARRRLCPSASRRLTGALFREFAFTLAGAVIVSGVVALTCRR
jgi:multidrug efflux pump subunit AcrB